ncbi:MAG: hypothetical protein A2864_01660 [Candidatus Woykebacteria bacterium RIFCSPHIGHO2_01_FULL_39_12]|uniref:NAD-dependent epimerase/dehydratase domain-containing protein n=1 Tax=Candidatus Woykebacteria bacterium RIFCSPHIGHO2_01_FULL_39_12 TaxID=1802599 RepID=A0A1G1WHT7_9BACT|nr:MAG: hypothetical protein A2864_01660 [Candidatus Woykebacteria bacterium RIFCSPHIGHO2_01_FULL_39_12]
MKAARNEVIKKFQKDNKKTALIAGGSGFIGSNLVEALLENEIYCIVVDNFSTGSKANLKAILTNSDSTILDLDIAEKEVEINNRKIDYVFHLARVQELADKEPSLEALLVNSLGTKNLLDLARKHDSKFILVSSADIYEAAISNTSIAGYFGKNLHDQVEMSHHEAKRFAEVLTFEYFKKYSVDSTIVRVKDVYGPRMSLSEDNELTVLISEAIKKNTLEMVGDGLKTLNPTFITDVISGLMKVYTSDFNGEIFTLVNPEKYTVRAVAETLRSLVGNIEIIQKKGKKSLEFPYYQLDVGSTQEKLNWYPRKSLKEGLLDTIAFYSQDQLKGETAAVVQQEKPPKQIRIKKGYLRVLLVFASAALVLLTSIYPTFAMIFNKEVGEKYLTQAITAQTEGRFSEANKKSAQAGSFFSQGDNNLRNIFWIASLLHQRDKLVEIEKLLLAEKNMAFSANLTSSALFNLQGDNLIKFSTEESLKQEVEDIRSKLENAGVKLELSRAFMASISESKLPGFAHRDFMNMRLLIDQQDNLISSYEQELSAVNLGE